MVGRVSYLGRVKQSNYHTHVLYTIPNPNYTIPKPYPSIITYPIHHPTLGTQTGRVLPCASINITLPWIPTYPYPSIVIPYLSTHPTNRRKNTPPYIEYLPHLPHPRHSVHTCTHLAITFITYPNLHFPTLYYCQGLIKYKAGTIYQIRRNIPRTETTQVETTQAETTQDRNNSGLKRKTRECSCGCRTGTYMKSCQSDCMLSILFGCEYSGILIYLLYLCSLILMILAQ